MSNPVRDEWGRCIPCNGNGAVMVPGTNTLRDCPYCDGTDTATPEMEGRAGE